MSTRKTLTTSLTAAVLVTGISLAWAQTEDQAPPADTTTPVAAVPSEQTPANPNAVALTDNSAAMPQQSDTTNPPPVDSTTPAPLSSDANSQATQSSTIDNSTSVTPAPDTSTSYEPAPRADRN